MKQLPNLNILRLFLATVVVLFHVPLLSKSLGIPYFNDLAIFQRGAEAVKFFFTLSGFLIIRLLYIEKVQQGAISLKKFYLRRILRIYPVYYLVVLIGILVYHVILPAAGIQFDIKYTFLQLATYYIFFLPNVFNIIYDPGAIFLVLWSIGIEEQFYLVIPLIMYAIKSKLVTTVLLLLMLVYMVVYFNSDVLKRFDMMYFYFLFGGILSILNQRLTFLRYKAVQILIIILFISIFFTAVPTYLNRVLSETYIMLVSGLFISMIAYYPPFIIKNKLLNYLGQVSYGIYMYHYIILYGVLFLYLKIFKQYSIPPGITIVAITLTTLLFTFITAHFSYAYYESFFLKLKKRSLTQR